MASRLGKRILRATFIASSTVPFLIATQSYNCAGGDKGGEKSKVHITDNLNVDHAIQTTEAKMPDDINGIFSSAELVQPPFSAPVLAPSEPIVIKFKKPVTPVGFSLNIGDSPPISLDINFCKDDAQYPNNGKPVFDSEGHLVTFEFGALAYYPLTGFWQSNTAYKLNIRKGVIVPDLLL